MSERTFAIVAVFVLLAVSCGTTSQSEDDVAQVMAASLYELVTVDNTFGGVPSPFTTYLIQINTDPHAGSPESTAATSRSLSADERGAIEAAMEPLGTVQWIDDPAEWRTDSLQPTIAGSAILGVGEPVFDSKGALVPVSLWCGGLCGTWFTYRLEHIGEGWQVIGIEGSRAIS